MQLVRLLVDHGALLLLLLALATLPVARAADDGDAFPGVEALMSDEEFSAAGLDRLTPAQLEALDAWLLRFTAGEAQALQESNEAVREAEKDYEVVARLSADFDGWTGDTVFRLDNGQVWRQRLDGRYVYRGPPAPEVRISRNFFGFFKMTLVDEGRGVGVSRVR